MIEVVFKNQKYLSVDPWWALALALDLLRPWPFSGTPHGLPVGPGIKPVTYTYRPYFIPSNTNTRFELVEQLESPDHRVVDIWSQQIQGPGNYMS